MELGEAIPIERNPRTNQEHRCADGPEEIPKESAGEKKKSVQRGRGAASQLKMDSGGDDEERADHDDKTGVFPTRVKNARRSMQHEDVIGNRDRGETGANLCVMPVPMLAQQRRRERDRQQQCREGHDAERMRFGIRHRHGGTEGSALSPMRKRKNVAAA